MSDAPSVLLLDDGELDRVHRMLKRLGADYLRLQGRKIGETVESPRDLLITSGPRTFECPKLEPAGGAASPPTWVCVHGQDFLPLRERLRDAGVHLLVHSALDEDSLRLLLLQLLHDGPERRGSLRLPLGVDVGYRVGSGLAEGRLAELSSEMCRIYSTQSIAPDVSISIFLPASLGGGQELELQGHTLRSVVCESRAGTAAFSTVVRVNDLDTDARIQLEKIVRGQQIGSRVSPLAEREAAPQPTDDTDRRGEPRREYRRRVAVLDFDDSGDSGEGLGHDLSMSGVRVAGLHGVSAGDEVTLALYAGRREEPAVVDAMVVRDDGEKGVALTFRSLSPGQRAQIEKLIGGRPVLESLQGDAGGVDPVIVARVTARRTAGSR